MALTYATLIDLNANELILDLDADTSITADSDDTIDFKIGGSDEIKMTTAALSPATADGNALGTAALEWSDIYLADGALIYFGDDQDTTLTHADGSGLTLNSTNKLMFNDASQFIQGSSATVLSIGATDEIDLTATAIDINGTVDISGTLTQGGASQFNSTITVGANDQGYDVILYGDTASANVTWDTSADDLIFNGGAGLIVPDGQFTLGSTAVTSTATEINLIDGGTSRGTDALASGDGILINDAGTMKMTNVDTVKTFMQSGLSSFDPDGAVTINDTGADVDFRVEGSGEANALFVQGSDGNVGIGTSTPAAKLIVTDSTTGITTHIKNSGATPNNNDNGVLFVQDSSSTSLRGPLLNVRSDTAFTGSYFAGINVNSASSNTHALWINQGGSGAAINVVGGNIVIGTAGKGIDFSATADGSGSMASEVLDDYEEGTWTPSFSGDIVFNTQQNFTYTKVGNVVTIMGYLNGGSGTFGTSWSISGLPYSSNGSYDLAPLWSHGSTYIFMSYMSAASMTIRDRNGATMAGREMSVQHTYIANT